ncbi:MAG: hypothetical protein N0A24_12215, partial [Armatimonadetes bacterium]|nr:hypothetical protein [Armatimonadota bacterium]MDW8154931.1 hypothetical protein [Armatimonadota bacterium]
MLAKRHPLVREAIYESIPARQRAHLHRQIAEQLEGNHIALPDEQRWLHWRRSEPDETVLARLWDRSER